MTKSVRLNSHLESKLRQAARRSGKSEAELLRIGLEKACDEILETAPPLEGEALKSFAESLIAKVDAAQSAAMPQHQNAQESELTRLMDAKERGKRRQIGVSAPQKAAA